MFLLFIFLSLQKKYSMHFFNGNSEEVLKSIEDNSIDLIVTSPPYDNLREYSGSGWDFNMFKNIAKELVRVLKDGGVIVWIVNDATINGSESLSSFKQAIYFKEELGLNVHDTMIWEKDTCGLPDTIRYFNIFEYMFVFSKGKPKTFNPIKDRQNKYAGTFIHGTTREKDGTTKRKMNHTKIQQFGNRFNIWKQVTAKGEDTSNHPAPFPEQLAIDHIISWSNKGDVVLDPFMGSGTTGVACKITDRDFIGIELSKEYFDNAVERINKYKVQFSLF